MATREADCLQTAQMHSARLLVRFCEHLLLETHSSMLQARRAFKAAAFKHQLFRSMSSLKGGSTAPRLGRSLKQASERAERAKRAALQSPPRSQTATPKATSNAYTRKQSGRQAGRQSGGRAGGRAGGTRTINMQLVRASGGRPAGCARKAKLAARCRVELENARQRARPINSASWRRSFFSSDRPAASRARARARVRRQSDNNARRAQHQQARKLASERRGRKPSE